MKNYADRGGCYPPKPKAEADNTLRDLHNSSYHTKAEFNNCFIIHSKYFQSSKNIQNVFNGVLSGSQKNRSLLENYKFKAIEKMTSKYLDTKTLFKEAINLSLEAKYE